MDGRFPAALKECRLVVVRMWQANTTVSEIVAASGACCASVYSIWRLFKAEGEKAITVRPKGHKHGDGRHLSPKQEFYIQKQIIDTHTEQLKLDFALWTRGAVQLLIKQECGFDMPRSCNQLYCFIKSACRVSSTSRSDF